MKETGQKFSAFLLSTLVLVSCGKQNDSGEAYPGNPNSILPSSVIIGSTDWKPTNTLSASLAESVNAKSVAKLFMPSSGGRCTAFLIADNIVMTNHHCIESAADAVGVVATFGLDAESGAGSQEFKCDRFIGNNEELDFALLGCQGNPSAKYGKVALDETQVATPQDIYVLQVNCDYFSVSSCVPIKRIAYGKLLKFVADTETPSGEYAHDADTLGGSSDSPVFSASSAKVVALHHVGLGNNGLGRGTENRAVPMFKVAAKIRELFPSVLASTGTTPPTPPSPPVPPTPSSDEDGSTMDTAVAYTSLKAKAAAMSITKGDVDYISFSISRSAYISIAVDFENRKGDLDIQLLNAQGAKVAYSASVADGEYISKYLTAGKYYVKVYGYKSALNTYSLSVSAK